jgi:hypothetical protein
VRDVIRDRSRLFIPPLHGCAGPFPGERIANIDHERAGGDIHEPSAHSTCDLPSLAAPGKTLGRLEAALQTVTYVCW